MDFPQYRKYKNNQSYFKIDSLIKFTEYKVFGSKIEKYYFEVKILPDRNFIYDMLNDFELHWDKINKSEFEIFISKFKSK
jgi:hypothetical protein